MKGVIFTEFLKFVETKFDILMVDHLITTTNPSSKGAYTAVGTYDADELISMLVELAKSAKVGTSELAKAFGSHLFRHFVTAHAATLGDVSTTEQLLGSVEERIHVDVRKLYPDAELPRIDFRQIDEFTSQLTYSSTRPFADIAEGLIGSAIKHFKDPIQFVREDLSTSADGTHATFILTRER